MRETKITPIGANAEHEKVLQDLRGVLCHISPQMAANAFLYSLSTRALEYRAVLGSYWYAVAIPEHSPTDYWHCYHCGWNNPAHTFKNDYNSMQKLNEQFVSSRENAQPGTLRSVMEMDVKTDSGRPDYTAVHTDPQQCLLVLQHFLTLPPVQHSKQDELLLQKILQCVYAIEPHQRGRALQKQITKSRIIKSNAYEIDDLLNALGICGVLSSSRAPCYVVFFPNEYQRSPETDTDLLCPLNWWRACDGINQERYQIVFGKPWSGPVMIE